MAGEEAVVAVGQVTGGMSRTRPCRVLNTILITNLLVSLDFISRVWKPTERE